MKESLLEFLICPNCRHAPQIIRFPAESPKVSAAPRQQPQDEMSCGVLKCSCGRLYPIIDGVPRFLDNGIESFPDFVKEHSERLAAVCDVHNLRLSLNADGGQNDYDNIRKSFSQEWGIFDYDVDKTWGWTLQERKEVFLGDVKFSPEELRGKRMLDAGCGNGTLTAALSAFGMEIVGLDLNDGLGLAYRNRNKYSETAETLVQYVQGNLVSPPLKEGTFDLIYSSGVIHHTPSSRNTFASLVRLTKTGGRLYVWVYGKRGWLVRLFFGFGRRAKRCISLKSLMRLCRVLAPPFKLCAEVLNALGILKFRRRTTREVTLDLFDAFAPRYNHYHSEEEVRTWFEEHGFSNVRVSGEQKHGFGMYGDKR